MWHLSTVNVSNLPVVWYNVVQRQGRTNWHNRCWYLACKEALWVCISPGLRRTAECLWSHVFPGAWRNDHYCWNAPVLQVHWLLAGCLYLHCLWLCLCALALVLSCEVHVHSWLMTCSILHPVCMHCMIGGLASRHSCYVCALKAFHCYLLCWWLTL